MTHGLVCFENALHREEIKVEFSWLKAQPLSPQKEHWAFFWTFSFHFLSFNGVFLTLKCRTLVLPVDWRQRQRVRTKHGPGVHGPPVTDQVHGQFFYFYKKVLHQVNGHSKTEIVPKKDLTRRCRPMLTIDHKYLVVLTWRTLCLHMCSRKTVKLS